VIRFEKFMYYLHYFCFVYVSGSDKFEDALTLMTGKAVPKWFVYCWKFITPAISLVTDQTLSYTMFSFPLCNGFVVSV